ncbi:hypothetical protein [Streptomyces sp. NPDC054975]
MDSHTRGATAAETEGCMGLIYARLDARLYELRELAEYARGRGLRITWG